MSGCFVFHIWLNCHNILFPLNAHNQWRSVIQHQVRKLHHFLNEIQQFSHKIFNQKYISKILFLMCLFSAY